MRRKPLVLIIEDDSHLADIYSRHFFNHKYQVKTARRFEDAEKRIKKAIPDIIVVDIALEEKAGIAWIKSRRETEVTAKLPIIVLTGLGGREEIKEALAAGATKYFLKSQITPHELAEQISPLLTSP